MARCMKLDLDVAELNDIAYACEKIADGNPSGIDNTVSSYGLALLFRKKADLNIRELALDGLPPLLVAFSHEPGSTLEQVAAVRQRREQQPDAYDAIFDQIDRLSVAGAEALIAKQYEALGSAMNICHGLLNAIGVSTPDLERMVAIARESGAIGAKLTGAGGGGSIVALCPGDEDGVMMALERAGYRTLSLRKSKGEPGE